MRKVHRRQPAALIALSQQPPQAEVASTEAPAPTHVGKPRPSARRPKRHSRFSEAVDRLECLSYLALAMQTLGPRPTGQYNVWRSTKPGTPSPARLARVGGSWKAAVSAAGTMIPAKNKQP